MENMKTIAERLKEARELKGWTQAQLAIAADVSTGTIGNIESGQRQSKGSVPQIAKALGISYEWLANEVGPMVVPTGAAMGSLEFTGKVTGEHYTPYRVDPAPVARKPLSNFANTIAEMFDTLPDDPIVRSVVLGQITTAILKAGRQQESLQPPQPEPAPTPKTQSERHQ